MFKEGNGMSDERITEAIIRRVIQAELRGLPLKDVPPITSYLAGQVKSEEEQMVANRIADIIHSLHAKFDNDPEFQAAIDEIARLPGSKAETANKVALEMFQDRITWKRIFVLLYVTGQLAVKMVEAEHYQSVSEIEFRIAHFFRNNLLGWIREQGGWDNCLQELLVAALKSASKRISFGYWLAVATAGLVMGSYFTWRLIRG